MIYPASKMGEKLPLPPLPPPLDNNHQHAENSSDSIGHICLAALENSSAHGLPNVYRNKSPTLKLLWALLFVFGVGFVVVQVLDLTTKYYDYDVNVNVEIKFDRTLNFPAVTVCNTNPVLKSKLFETSAAFRRHFDGDYGGEEEGEGGGEDVVATTTSWRPPTAPIPATTTAEESTTAEPILSWDEKESQQFFESQSNQYTNTQMLITMLANMTVEERMAIGHQLDLMLLSCEWKGYPCSPSNFTAFYHYKYGNCYTFNSQMFGNQDQLAVTNRPGPLYGLALELYAEQVEYMDLTPTAGFKIVTHNPHEMPFPEDEGISISPGYETSIGIRVREVKRLPAPYSDKCVSSKPDGSDDFYNENYGVAYRMKTCERSCYQREVMDQCGCADPRYPYPVNSTVDVCSLSGENENIECIQDVVHRYVSGDLSCDKHCPLSCLDRSFRLSMSSNIWPSDAYQRELHTRMKKANSEMRAQMFGGGPSEWTKKNVARVLVYFEEFNYELINQSPSYSVIDLASDIGGQLGLWIGVSILTICELVQSLGVIVLLLFRKVFYRRKTRIQAWSKKAPLPHDLPHEIYH